MVGCVLPVAAEALVSLSIIKVELMTLLGMYGAGILGAVVGGKIAGKLPIRALRITMGTGLGYCSTIDAYE